MSVPEGKRTKPQLAFHTKARELAEYTTTICNSNSIFPKRDRWMIASKIVDASLVILTGVVKANGVYVSTQSDYQLRRKYQEVARDATLEMLALIDFAHYKYRIESKRISHWTKLTIETRDLILKWMKSDKDRFKDL